MGRAGLGAARGEAPDHADPRPPVEPEPERSAVAGARCLGARLLPAVREPESGVLWRVLERVQLAGRSPALRHRAQASAGRCVRVGDSGKLAPRARQRPSQMIDETSEAWCSDAPKGT